MIISASRRTDIPAFYADWFYNRLKDGFVVTRNPFNANQLSKLRLSKDMVDAIVFWTKNPRPMMDRLDRLDESGIPYYFQFTLTPYRRDIEPGLADKREIVRTFQELAARIGSERVIWRYDPILFSNSYTLAFHKAAFAKCAQLLEGSTQRIVISFIDMDYKNTKRISGHGIGDGTAEERAQLACFIAEEAWQHGMDVFSCAEEIDLESCGIKHGCCVDPDLIERIAGKRLSAKGRAKDKSQRPACGCVASTDIGSYNTCRHGCGYCYANYSPNAIAANALKHDPASPVLLGTCENADELPFRKSQASSFEKESGQPKKENEQLSLF